MEKKMIWSNYNLNFKDWEEDLQAENPDMEKESLYSLMYEENDLNLDADRMNLNVEVDNGILIIADVGLWNGRRQGCLEIPGNIQNCLDFQKDCDYAEWYVDGYGNLRSRQSHHDGTHYLLYRAYKENISDEQKENLCHKIKSRDFTSGDLSRYTRQLGNDIQAVFGW